MKKILFLLIPLAKLFTVHCMENPYDAQELVESLANHQKLNDFYVLRQSMRSLNQEEMLLHEKREISPGLRESLLFYSPVRRGSEGDTATLDCQISILNGCNHLSKGNRALAELGKNNSILSEMLNEESYDTIEENYLKAIDIFIQSYEKKCYDAFNYISMALKSTLELEQTRSTQKRHLYVMNEKLAILYERIQRIYEQEHARKQLEKKSEKRMSGFASFDSAINKSPESNDQINLQYEKAKRLSTMARGLKANMKQEDIEQLDNIETLCFESIDLSFQVFEANKNDEALEMAEETFEFIQSIEASKVTSNRLSYSVSPEFSQICQKMRDYREKRTPKTTLEAESKEMSWQDFLQLPMKQKEEVALKYQATIAKKAEDKQLFKKFIDKVQDRFKPKK